MLLLVLGLPEATSARQVLSWPDTQHLYHHPVRMCFAVWIYDIISCFIDHLFCFHSFIYPAARARRILCT